MIARMSSQPSHYLVREAHLIALARALRSLSDEALDDALNRARAYARDGIVAWSGVDDAEALRRVRVYWRRVALAAARGPQPLVAGAPELMPAMVAA